MNSLKRFQLPEQGTRQQEELDSVEPKNISDVVNFNSAGVFYVLGKVTNMQYRVYKACPFRSKGLICRRKLSDDNMCEACGQKAIAPIHTVFVRLLLQDVEQADIAQRVTMFSSVAEEFLGMKAAELLAKEKEPESLAKHLDDLIAVKLIAKVNIKANSQTYTGFDWIVNLFKKCPGKNDSDVPKEKDDDAGDVDGIATKKAKKN
ncbi:hypothetical protein niasHS_013943 [Heterodera schachtii]|uniref:Replication factor A C-terminal domain-containing protein n=2 Tax=Heterodera TaxID=34509 RepID=A0ABD2LQY5_9BILA